MYPVVCFFVLFMCFLPFAFDMSNCRGKTCCKSLTVLRGVQLLEAGFCSRPASPNFPQSGLSRGEGDTERDMVSGRLSQEIKLLYPPTFSCPHCAVSL